MTEVHAARVWIYWIAPNLNSCIPGAAAIRSSNILPAPTRRYSNLSVLPAEMPCAFVTPRARRPPVGGKLLKLGRV